MLGSGHSKALFTSEFGEFKPHSDFHRQAFLSQVVGIPLKCKIKYISWRKNPHITIKLHKNNREKSRKNKKGKYGKLLQGHLANSQFG